LFKKIVLVITSLFLLSACSDNSTVTIFEKNIPKEKITCINLLIFPPNEKVQTAFESLYTFSENCSIKLEVSTKSGITCNSNHNYQIKAVGEFPSSYLKMQLNSGSKIVYSYYIDLKEEVNTQDISRAFLRMRDDLNID